MPDRISNTLSWVLQPLLLLTSLVVGVCLGAQSNGGSSLAPGWPDLAAGPLVEAAEILFQSDPPPTLAHQQEVVAHTWDAFLNDGAFVATGDLSVVQAMTRLFVPRRQLRFFSGADRAAIESDLETLQARLRERLDANPDAVVQGSFDQLRELGAALDTADQPAADRARLFASWMDANDWQSLSPGDQADLFKGLSADQVNLTSMAARWTGSITAPRSGEYKFQLIRPYGHTPTYRLSIGGRLIWDSAEQTETDLQYFESAPVQLVADVPTAIRIELVNDAGGSNVRGEGSPLMILLWESSRVARQLVPTTALSPPSGFGDPGATGLQGEYFNGPSLDDAQPVVTRLDPSLEFAWTEGPVVPVYPDKCQAILDGFVTQTRSDAYLAGLTAGERVDFLDRAVRSLATRLPVSERQQLVSTVAANETWLSSLSDYAVAGLISAMYMLPGDEHLALIASWSAARGQPRTTMGELPDPATDHRNTDSYYTNNLEFYRLLGTFFGGPYWSDMESLVDSNLTLPNGACNLRVAYASAYATQLYGQGSTVSERIAAALEDETLSGDERMTWLLARAYLESLVPGNVLARLHRGVPILEEALLTASSGAYGFWALQELVARLGATDRVDEAQALIRRHEGQFTSGEQRVAMAEWGARADELAELYATRRETEDEVQRDASLLKFVRSLQERLARATVAGNEHEISRNQQLLENARHRID